MNIEKLEHSRVKVTFDVKKEEFETALDYSFNKNNAKVTIKGFRKGKAPRDVFEKHYSVEALYEDALDYIFNQKLFSLSKDESFEYDIVGNIVPDLDKETKVERGVDFKASLEFDVRPEFNLPQYKGVEVKEADTNVTSEEVNNAINALIKPKAKKEAKEDKTIALGDIAVFDFEGFIEDKAFEGGKASNYELKIGSKQFIPGFEDQMVGMKEGETKDVIVTFPTDYQATDLAGKEAKFVVTVHQVLNEVLPELTDDFVASLNIKDVKNKEELEAYELNELKKRKEVAEKDRQTNELINKILDNTVIDMPQSEIDSRVKALRSQYENQAKMYNIPFDTFLQLMGTDKEKFETETYNQGKRNAIFTEVFSKIVEVEKLEPSEEELKADLGITDDKKKVTQEQYQQSYSKLAYNKFIEFLLANATYTK